MAAHRADTEAPAPSGAIDSGPQRLTGLWAHAAAALAASLAIIHLYFPFAPTLSAYLSPVTETLFGVSALPSSLQRNTFHFAGFALLLAMTTPIVAAAWAQKSSALRWVDLAFGLLAASAALYLSAPGVVATYYATGAFTPLDWAAGVICVIAALELTRRSVGIIVPAIAVIGLGYLTVLGPYAPSPFTFRGLSAEATLVAAIYEDEGMFGLLAGISATTIFPFIIFGAFLVRSGAGDFVIALAKAVAGRLAGGPGLIAVIASGLTGTISGSAVANTASTGVITIPLMKRSGFPAPFAGAVEAGASTGGQLMPPIMGAGAFVMASYTNIPYETIIAVAALPALLYFASVAFFVRIEARRLGLGGSAEEGPTLGAAVRESGASFIIPIALMITLLVVGFTPPYAAVLGIAAIILSSYLTQRPMGLVAIWQALVMGGRNMAMMAVLLCAVGLIVNAIVKAGVGNTFSLMIETWAGGNLLIAIILVAIASLVLGMGLPVTAAYIVLATLSAPALAGMIGDAAVAEALTAGQLGPAGSAILMLGAPEAAAALSGPMPAADASALVASLPFELRASLRDAVLSPAALTAALLSAHMIVFWLSQDSNVTPPVCLAAFTAATIANAPPMRTGLESWKLAKGLYIIPVLFAYTPFLSGDWLAALWVFAFALAGLYALAAGLQGWLATPLAWPLRVLLGAIGLLCLWPEAPIANVAGAFSLVVCSLLLARSGRAAATASD
ncbi:MAG: TRAP transporter fused permease subunit [Pseudomonadota bacterium]